MTLLRLTYVKLRRGFGWESRGGWFCGKLFGGWRSSGDAWTSGGIRRFFKILRLYCGLLLMLFGVRASGLLASDEPTVFPTPEFAGKRRILSPPCQEGSLFSCVDLLLCERAVFPTPEFAGRRQISVPSLPRGESRVFFQQRSCLLFPASLSLNKTTPALAGVITAKVFEILVH